MKQILLILLGYISVANSTETTNTKVSMEFGDVKSSIATFRIKSSGLDDIDLVFNIDKFPYTQNVNLCSDIKVYRNLKSVMKNLKGEIVEKTFEESSNECNSTFTVNSFFDDQVLVGIDLKSATGFTTSNVFGYTNHFPIIRSYITRTFLTDSVTSELSTQYENGNLVKHVTAEFKYN